MFYGFSSKFVGSENSERILVALQVQFISGLNNLFDFEGQNFKCAFLAEGNAKKAFHYKEVQMSS